MMGDWITPDWPAPANIRALCTTRTGGFSEGPGPASTWEHVAATMMPTSRRTGICFVAGYPPRRNG